LRQAWAIHLEINEIKAGIVITERKVALVICYSMWLAGAKRDMLVTEIAEPEQCTQVA
jgi:hypothetical protein